MHLVDFNLKKITSRQHLGKIQRDKLLVLIDQLGGKRVS